MDAVRAGMLARAEVARGMEEVVAVGMAGVATGKVRVVVARVRVVAAKASVAVAKVKVAVARVEVAAAMGTEVEETVETAEAAKVKEAAVMEMA